MKNRCEISTTVFHNYLVYVQMINIPFYLLMGVMKNSYL